MYLDKNRDSFIKSIHKIIDYKNANFNNGYFNKDARNTANKIKEFLFESLYSINEDTLIKHSLRLIENTINQNTQFINEVSEKIEINRQRQIDIIKEIELYKESNIELIDIPFVDQNKKRYFDILIELAFDLKSSIVNNEPEPIPDFFNEYQFKIFKILSEKYHTKQNQPLAKYRYIYQLLKSQYGFNPEYKNLYTDYIIKENYCKNFTIISDRNIENETIEMKKHIKENLNT